MLLAPLHIAVAATWPSAVAPIGLAVVGIARDAPVTFPGLLLALALGAVGVWISLRWCLHKIGMVPRTDRRVALCMAALPALLLLLAGTAGLTDGMPVEAVPPLCLVLVAGVLTVLAVALEWRLLPAAAAEAMVALALATYVGSAAHGGPEEMGLGWYSVLGMGGGHLLALMAGTGVPLVSAKWCARGTLSH